MGFHRRLKLVQPPLPQFSIVLEGQPKHVYRSGDRLKGYIILTSAEKMILDIVNNVQTSQSGNVMLIDKAPLLKITKDLTTDLPSPYLDPKHTYKLPFSFKFSHDTHSERQSYMKPHDQRWTTAVHDLPPTFWDWLTTRGMGWKKVGLNVTKVDYGVKATLKCPGVGVVKKKELQDVTASRPVLFAPRSTENPSSCTEENLVSSTSRTIRSSAIIKATRMNCLPTESIRGLKARKTNITLATKMPDTIRADSEFQFTVSVTFSDRPPSVHWLPMIQITIVKMSLLSFTLWRAPTLLTAKSMKYYNQYKNTESMCFEKDPKEPMTAFKESYWWKREQCGTSKHETRLNVTTNSVTVPQQNIKAGKVTGAEVGFSCYMPGTIPSNFRSFAISRNYTVKVSLRIEMAAKRFKVKQEFKLRRLQSGCALQGPMNTWKHPQPQTDV